MRMVPDFNHASERSRLRVLFDCPYGREFYLGERVYHQFHNHSLAPLPPPEAMRYADQMDDEEAELWLIGDDADG